MKNPPPSSQRRSKIRYPTMLLGVTVLLLGMWAGLQRIGWNLPPLDSTLLFSHGPFMISGFLGALISLEKVVALAIYQPRRRFLYLFPLMAAVGAAAMLLPVPEILPKILIFISGLGYVGMFVLITWLQPNSHHVVMGLGAAAWAGGSLLWLLGQEIFQIVPWWAAYLVLTIAGERLEMARMLKLTPTSRLYYLISAGAVVLGLIISLFSLDLGVRVLGLGWLLLGLWMLRYDIATRTIRGKGLPQYIAACLLPGYVWLALAGVLWIILGWRIPAGPLYDAQLHMVFVGFVFSMIFGHAPVIIPAVLGVLIRFNSAHYIYLAILHLSLFIRITSDLFFWAEGRRWGGLGNVIAILLFLAITVLSRTQAPKIPKSTPAEPV